jgi:hypothetical protein
MQTHQRQKFEKILLEDHELPVKVEKVEKNESLTSLKLSRIRVGPIWVQPIPIQSHSQYFCQYQYICTNISATNTDIFLLADICPISGIFADT